jgi:cyanophycinase
VDLGSVPVSGKRIHRRNLVQQTAYIFAGLLASSLACLSILHLTSPSIRAETPGGATLDRPESSKLVKGSLVIIGGSERFDNAAIWSTIVELAGGRGGKIAVIPTASGYPVEYGTDIVRVLNQAGADAFIVPVALRGFDRDHKEVVSDPKLSDEVRQSDGVFFVGGEQSRIKQVLMDDAGNNTPLLDAIWDVYRHGGVIAGTSAGAAVMSRIMFRNGRSVLGTMLNGISMGREVDTGLGFMDPDWFVDQHCLVRGRFARALVAMQKHGFRYGIGVDEDSAVVVQNDEARVIGYRGAIVMDLSEASSDDRLEHFNLKNAKLTYLDRGDSINLETLEVTPSPEKASDRRVDPHAPDFRPLFRHRIFSNDILGNTAVLDVMYKLLDNRHDEAFGLAFDGAAARLGPVDGFEFRFFRDADTMGWETESFGGDDYTIVNIHLDITPIRLTGPLYLKETDAAPEMP